MGSAGVVFVRRHQALLSCQTEPASTGSKMDLQLPKAEPVSSTGGISVITYLRKHKKRLCNRYEKGIDNVKEAALKISKLVM